MRFYLLLLIMVFFSTSVKAKDSTQVVCAHFYLIAPERITFSPNEKKLMCGDENVAAWRNIPVTQAKFQLGVFLQDRGYFSPKFSTEGNRLVVEVGAKTFIRELRVNGNVPEFFDITRRRKMKGELLTPDRLTELEDWARVELRAHGYPCPRVTSEADPHSGVVVLTIASGPFENFTPLLEEPIPSLRTGALRRYDAFELDKPYDLRLLQLTSLRIQNAGLVQSTYFQTTCTDEGIRTVQKFIPGKSRLITVGFGANTEEYGIVKAAWKSLRLGDMGSSLEVSAYGSYRKQQLSVGSQWYLLPEPSRWYLRPLLSLTREAESDYEYISADLRLTPGFSYDSRTVGLKMFFGPKLNFTRTFKGADRELTRFVSTVAAFELMSHDYEYYQTDPRSGFAVQFSAELNHEDILSDVTAQQLQLGGQYLWNVGNFDPALLILGLRGGVSTTVTERKSPRFAKLPPQFFYFLGGTRDLRGFGRKELPGPNQNALSMAFLSVEARLSHVLPLNLEPIAFSDIGILGDDSFDFDAPLYVSPGLGLRWLSPVGVFRTSIARGFVVGPQALASGHWQFQFSFGEEF